MQLHLRHSVLRPGFETSVVIRLTSGCGLANYRSELDAASEGYNYYEIQSD